jgi:AcrR family transcriptional regulator
MTGGTSAPQRRSGSLGPGERERQRLDPTERREQILACAMRLFEDRSYAEVSTADIADAAGIRRPLIHHYFGTKRELYLEVVRRLAYVPAVAVRGVAGGVLDERIDSSISRWLDVAWRHRKMWLATITPEGPGRDREIEQILRQADEIAAERMIEAVGLDDHPNRGVLRTLMLAFGPLAKAASRQWLEEKTLTRGQVHALLTATMRTIITEVLPTVTAGEAIAGEAPPLPSTGG